MGQDDCSTDQGGAGGPAETPTGLTPYPPLGEDDYDCAGGTGDGPSYVDGPVEVSGADPYDLDRDNNGIGCE
jgi:resuscitation-promoting factor RpfB